MDSNFDDIVQAMLTMFKVAITEGWLEIMYVGVDSIGAEKVPHERGTIYWAAYFVFFIVVGCFFTLNLFDGIVIDNFNTETFRSQGLKRCTSG